MKASGTKHLYGLCIMFFFVCFFSSYKNYHDNVAWTENVPGTTINISGRNVISLEFFFLQIPWLGRMSTACGQFGLTGLMFDTPGLYIYR